MEEIQDYFSLFDNPNNLGFIMYAKEIYDLSKKLTVEKERLKYLENAGIIDKNGELTIDISIDDDMIFNKDGKPIIIDMNVKKRERNV